MSDYQLIFKDLSTKMLILRDIAKNEDRCKSYESLTESIKDIIKKLKSDLRRKYIWLLCNL